MIGCFFHSNKSSFDSLFFPLIYTFSSFILPQEVKGSRAVPLPGLEVALVPSTPADRSEVKHVFRLSHAQQTWLFSAQEAELQLKWVEVLSKAAHGEAPADVPLSLTEHRKSQ